MAQLDPTKYKQMEQTTRLDPNKYRTMQQPQVDTPTVNTTSSIPKPGTVGEENGTKYIYGLKGEKLLFHDGMSKPLLPDLGNTFDTANHYVSDKIGLSNLPAKGLLGSLASGVVETGRTGYNFLRDLSTPEGIIGSAQPKGIKLPENVRIIPKPPITDFAKQGELDSMMGEYGRLKSPVNAPSEVVSAPHVSATGKVKSVTDELLEIANKNKGKDRTLYLTDTGKVNLGGNKTPPRNVNKIKTDLSGSETATKFGVPDEVVNDAAVIDDLSRQSNKERILAQHLDNTTVAPEVTLSSKVTKKTEPKVSIMDAANLPKSTSASMDISFPGRQGLWLIGRKGWWQSWKPMVESLASEQGYLKSQQAVANSPKFKEAVENGLAVTDFLPDTVASSNLSKRALKKISEGEEQFASKIANLIPGIKQSSRAYTSFGNNLRMKVYESMSDAAETAAANGGLDLATAKKNIADYINSATGRGSMGLRIGESSQRAENAAELLNTVFWSPRFLTSRVQLLNPASYTKLDPVTRKEALKDLVKVTGAGLTAIGLTNLAGGEVSLNPVDTDFLKAKFGDTRVDMSGGFSSIIRFMAQAIDGVANISEKDAKGPDVLRFLRSKLSPAASLFVDQVTGEDYLRNDVKTAEERGKNLGGKFVPMVIQDFYELARENPELLGLGLTSLVGGGVQTYGDKDSKGSSKSGFPKVELPSFPKR